MNGAVDLSPEGVKEKLDRLIELTERQNALLEGSTEDDLSEPLVKVSTRREVEFLAGVRAVDGPIATATLAARLGWKQEINAHRALAIARFLAKQLDRRGRPHHGGAGAGLMGAGCWIRRWTARAVGTLTSLNTIPA